MKKFFIAATAILMITGSLQAQTGKERMQGTHHRNMHGKKVFAGINLSDDQKKKAKELNESYQKQFGELHKNNSMSVGDYRNKTAALKKERHEKMQALLTPEQKTQLVTQRKEMQQKMKEGEARRFDRMKTQLGLSDEQTKKLSEKRTGFQSKVKSIREDKTLTDSQKREQVKALSKQQREEMKTILTPEQLQKMRSGHRNKNAESKK